MIDRVLFINFIIILLHETVLLYYNYYKMINLFPYELNLCLTFEKTIYIYIIVSNVINITS